MAVDKNKLIASAQRLTQKGQLDRAIREYRLIVEDDPSDIRVWMKIGDLYVRKGAIPHAIATYIKVAVHYREGGHHQKAAAVYKQIIGLAPGAIDAHLALGELYAKLNQPQEAISELQIVVGAYEREGRHRESCELLQRIVELGPEDEPNRIRLAEAFARQGNLERAGGEFRQVLSQLSGRGRLDDYIQVAERLLYLAPDQHEVARTLAEVYLQRGQPKRALARLQTLFQLNPTDPKVLTMLGQAFRDLGYNAKAASVYRELARVHGADGDEVGRTEALRRLLQVEPDDAEARAAVGVVVRSSNAPAAAGAALSSPPRPIDSPSETDRAAGLIRDVDLLIKYELFEHALTRLEKVFLAEPDSVPGLERRATLLLRQKRERDAMLVYLRLADLSRGDQAMDYLGRVLQIDPEHLDAKARLRGLSGGMAARREEPPPMLVPSEDPFEVELDLDGVDFDDGLRKRFEEVRPTGDALDFELDLDALEPPPDDDAFGDLLNDPEEPSRSGRSHPSDENSSGRQAFGDLLSSQEDFGDLLAPEPASGVTSIKNSNDFGGLLAPDADPLAGALVPDAPVPPRRASFAPQAKEDADEFGDLLSGAVLSDADFSDRDGRRGGGFSSVHASEVMDLEDGSFADLLAPEPAAPSALDLDLDSLAFGTIGEDTGLDEERGTDALADLLSDLDDGQFDAEIGVIALPGVMEDDGDGLEAIEDDDLFELDEPSLAPRHQAPPTRVAPPPQPAPRSLLAPPLPAPAARAPQAKAPPALPSMPELPGRGASLRDQLARVSHRSGPPRPAPPPPPGGSLFDLRTETPAPMPAEPVEDDEGLGDLADLSGAEFFNIGGSVEWPPLTSELAELDFLLNGRLALEARELLSELSQQHPGHPELSDRLDRILEIESSDQVEREAEQRADALLDGVGGEVDFGTIQGSMISDLAEDDASSHLDLGLAFKEMGQFQKAIGLLEKARRSRELFAEATRVLALVHIERGQPQQAVELLVEALSDSRARDRARVALRWELAGAYEATGRRDRAVDELRAVAQASNPEDFPGIAERLARLLGG